MERARPQRFAGFEVGTPVQNKRKMSGDFFRSFQEARRPGGQETSRSDVTSHVPSSPFRGLSIAQCPRPALPRDW